MSAVDEAVTRQQALVIKMNQTQDLVKVVGGKVDDGVNEISAKVDVVSGKVDYIWTLTDVRFKGVENERAAVYGEMTHVKDDMVNVAKDVVTITTNVVTVSDDVAMVANLVHQLKQRQLLWNLAFFIMLGYITYVVSLPVTVCPFSVPMGPNHTEPVDECKNLTNIIGGLRCLTDKMLPKPCRDGYACKRDTYPDW